MATVAKQSAGKASRGAGGSVAGVSGVGKAIGRIKTWPVRFRAFYDAVRREMKLVTWPTQAQERSTTAVVLITVFLFALFFGVVDLGLSTGMNRLYQFFTQ
jgi:preprotein translocase subunit SecE